MSYQQIAKFDTTTQISHTTHTNTVYLSVSAYFLLIVVWHRAHSSLFCSALIIVITISAVSFNSVV